MTEDFEITRLELTEDVLEKINRFTRSKFDSDKLYAFNVTLCNNDIDRDYEKFSVEALRELAELFIGKTGISDHSMRSADQKARVYDAYVERIPGRKTADGEDFYCLKAGAYMVRSSENEQLITEIEAGIKKEVSVSCSMAESICSVCGADRKKDGCKHIKGKIYDGKRAFDILSRAEDAYEFSFVAVPAQREAGVTKTFNQAEKGVEVCNMKDLLKAFKTCEDSIVLTKSQAQEAAEYIEELEEEAQLGRDYKKSLCDEVVRLCALSVPEMDIEVFKGVASIMTAKELGSFKKAFSKRNYESSAARQIKSDGSERKFDQFKI